MKANNQNVNHVKSDNIMKTFHSAFQRNEKRGGILQETLHALSEKIEHIVLSTLRRVRPDVLKTIYILS